MEISAGKQRRSRLKILTKKGHWPSRPSRGCPLQHRLMMVSYRERFIREPLCSSWIKRIEVVPRSECFVLIMDEAFLF